MVHLAYYGDDFTGSTDVMEVLQWAGLRTVLFLDPPTKGQLASFENLRAWGVAGWSRTMSPQEMQEELPPLFAQFKELHSGFVHYKICSTFDSSPSIGSLGKVLEIGRNVFGENPVPVLVGAPNLGRYQVFGHLFARSGLDTEPYRIDRHPTMSRHPVTPMDEADLTLHLKRQTDLPLALMDILKLESTSPREAWARLMKTQAGAILMDVLNQHHLRLTGEILASLRSVDDRHECTFLIGSSGIEYALTKYWEASGRLTEMQSHPPERPPFQGTRQLLVITGSCSPVNRDQVEQAMLNGFQGLMLNTADLIPPASRNAEVQRSIDLAVDLLKQGYNVILHSSLGPDDPRIPKTMEAYKNLGYSQEEARLKNGRTLGPVLGAILKGILMRHPLHRFAVTGGDTSGYVARELGIEALEAIAPVAPGSPLCRIHAPTLPIHHSEVLFKGGQVGTKNVWTELKNGNVSNSQIK